jgi:PAS domain S-box-containing protein
MKKKKGEQGMRRIIKTTVAVLAVLLILISIFACGRTAGGQFERYVDSVTAPVSPFASYRDIPGVTAEEIAAIEALKERYSHFVYGLDHTTEAFLVHLGEDNEVGGYAARICEWLTNLFGIPFIPTLYADDWHNLLAELESGNVHFMGDLMPTEERRETHYMTGTISERRLTAFQIPGVPSITEIAKSRPPRLAFPRDYILHTHTIEITEYVFESVFVDNYAHAYSVIASGEADAFMTMHTAEPTLSRYGDVVSETFFPLIFASASLSTQSRDLVPIISVVQKALESGAMSHLAKLHTQGRYDFLKNELYKRLTDKERDYIQSNPIVKIMAETENYPISFYNDNENEFQGIALDILSELKAITGLSFEIADTRYRTFTSGADIVESGEVSMITELGLRGRGSRFLWPETPIMRDHSIFISKSEFPDVYFNELENVSVGMVRGTGRAALFNGWFPNNTGYKEYDNSDSAFNALENGEIDLLLTRSNYLLSLENYKEIAGYRANIILDDYFNCFFGFNKDEQLLCGIIDKALQLIDLEAISGSWTHRTFDYRSKIVEVRLPWLIGAIVLSLVVLILILIMFLRSRSERKRLAKLVREETATLQAILDATPDHLFCKDMNRRFIRCNKNMADYHKIRSEDFIGKTEAEVFEKSPESLASLNAIESKIFEDRKVNISDDMVLTPGGGGVQFFETIRAPLILDGKVTGLVGMGRDITQRKAAEEEAKKASAEAMKAYAEAESASEAKSRFVANMSHEMRTPMNVIVGLTDLMLEEEDASDKSKETLKKINTAGTTLMGIINDVLDISKIEAGRQELKPAQYDVASLLNDIIALNMIRIGEKPITFKLDINEGLPRSLFGDDLRVKQILNNLLGNAFKYTETGTVTLSADYERDGAIGSANDVWVSFCISDTGIGIREEDMEKLFTDYNQVDTRANRRIEGTGLGLSITKKIVEMMGGEITVESEYGKGTTFRIRIRQGYVTDNPIGKETAENLRTFRYTDRKKQAQGKLVRADLRDARVLVVDDFLTNLDVAAGMLRKYKMQVDCITNGQEAVDRIAAGRPVYDAIFMDHMMPGMDGVEATQAIRAIGTEYAEKIPIIALTANAVAGNEQMFLDNGFNAFLSKPFNAVTLDTVIRRLVRDELREK